MLGLCRSKIRLRRVVPALRIGSAERLIGRPYDNTLQRRDHTL